ncbi:transcription termination factor 4, mitochondrial isoform X1 [Pseudophryne corroboree]|uniref:transcription termination factor 4, mitochondrial isoform X1 n=1 Tax=Pseudophryne corroboree TaxID=495146 RepID=UPI0030816170
MKDPTVDLPSLPASPSFKLLHHSWESRHFHHYCHTMFWEVPYLILRRLRAQREQLSEEAQYESQQRQYRETNNINRRQFLRRRRRRRIFPVRINLSEIDEHDIKERYRLNSDAIMSLYELIKKDLISTTKRSNAVPGIVKLLCALHYFTSGSLQSTVAEAGGITQSTFSRALSEVISAILKLTDQFINFPRNPAGLQLLKDGFQRIDGFPNVIGVVGCTHIAISPPSEMEQRYRNRKHYHSINVQLVCDSDMRILDVVSQFPGSTDDSSVLNQTEIHDRFESGEFNGWLLGDSGYGVKPWLLTPFDNPATNSEIRYNLSHAATYSVMEQTIDVLKSRFRCLDNPNGVLLYNPEKVCKIIVVCCIIHNIAVLKNIDIDIALDLRPPIKDESIEDDTMQGSLQRDKVMADYFSD